MSGQGDCEAPKSSSSRYTLTIVKADLVSWSGSPSRSTCLSLPAVGAELGCCPPEQQGTSRQSHDLDGGVEWMSPTGPPGSVSAHRPPGHTSHARCVRGLAAVAVFEKYSFLLSFVSWLFYFILSQSLPLPQNSTDIFLSTNLHIRIKTAPILHPGFAWGQGHLLP